MRLHVLAGCRELLQPEFLTPEMTAELIGPRVRIPMAFWIAPIWGTTYHSFLQDEPGDSRTSVMAQALKDEFGKRFEPLLVLIDLLNEFEADEQRALPAAAADRRSQTTVLSEILGYGHIRELRLYAVALPSEADPDGCWAVPSGIVPGTVHERIERLASLSKADIGLDSVEIRIIEATPELPVFNALYNNSFCNQVALRLAPRLHEQGYTSDPETLKAAIFRVIADWNKSGILLALPLRAHHLDAITDLVYEKLI